MLYSQGLKLNPNNIGIINNKGIALIELKRLDEAN